LVQNCEYFTQYYITA